MVFHSIFGLLFIPLAVIGLTLLWRGWRGAPELSEPRCAKCRYDLRGQDWMKPQQVCPECGSDLTQAGAVLFGVYRRRPRLMLAGVAVLVLPFLLIAAMTFWAASRNPRRTSRSTASVIANLANTMDEPWDWQILETRFTDGSLTREEATAAIDQLIAYLKANPSPTARPLQWERRFVEWVMNAGFVSNEQLGRLGEVFYQSTVRLEFPQRVRQGEKPRFRMEAATAWQLPGMKTVQALRIVTVDGTPVMVVPRNSSIDSVHGLSVADYGNSGIQGEIGADLNVGQHELVFEIDCGLLDDDASLDPRLRGCPGQRDRWPSPRHVWSLQMTRLLEVVPPDAPVVTLITDPQRDPLTNGSIAISSIQVVSEKGRLSLRPQIKAERIETPVCFRIRIEFDGGSTHLGGFGTDSRRHFNNASSYVESLPADLTHLTVILEPDVKAAEADLRLTEIWGEPIIIEHVPLERWDLKDDLQPQSQPTPARGQSGSGVMPADEP